MARADSVETTPRQREEVRPYPLPGLAEGGQYQDEGSGVSRMLLGEKLGNHGISTTEEFTMNYLRGE